MTTLADIQKLIEGRDLEFVSLLRGVPFSCWIVVKGVSGTFRGHGPTVEAAYAAALAQVPGSARKPAVTIQMPGLPQPTALPGLPGLPGHRTRMPGLPT